MDGGGQIVCLRWVHLDQWTYLLITRWWPRRAAGSRPPAGIRSVASRHLSTHGNSTGTPTCLPALPARTVFLLAASTVPASSQLPDMLTELRLGFLKNFTRKMSELGRWLYQIWCPHVYLAAHVESHSHVIQAAMSRDADCAMYKHLHCFYRKNPALTLTTMQSFSGFSVTASISIISIVYLNRCVARLCCKSA